MINMGTFNLTQDQTSTDEFKSSGTGSTTELTPSSGENWECVENVDTKYVSCAEVKDGFGLIYANKPFAAMGCGDFVVANQNDTTCGFNSYTFDGTTFIHVDYVQIVDIPNQFDYPLDAIEDISTGSYYIAQPNWINMIDVVRCNLDGSLDAVCNSIYQVECPMDVEWFYWKDTYYLFAVLDTGYSHVVKFTGTEFTTVYSSIRDTVSTGYG